MPHQRGRQPRSQYRGRQQQRTQVLDRIFTKRHEPRRWQPLQIDREDQNQQDPEPEMRYRDPRDRHKVGTVIDPAVFIDRREDPHADAKHQRDDHRQQRQLQRHRQFAGNELGDRLVSA